MIPDRGPAGGRSRPGSPPLHRSRYSRATRDSGKIVPCETRWARPRFPSIPQPGSKSRSVEAEAAGDRQPTRPGTGPRELRIRDALRQDVPEIEHPVRRTEQARRLRPIDDPPITRHEPVTRITEVELPIRNPGRQTCCGSRRTPTTHDADPISSTPSPSQSPTTGLSPASPNKNE